MSADLHAQSEKSFGLTGLVANDQVNIKQFIIPKSASAGLQPIGILTLSQNMTDSVPSLNLSFGNLGPLVQAPSSTKLGQLNISQNEDERFDRRSSTPKMKGDAAKLKPYKCLNGCIFCRF
ncbi:MAG: hypothetical protein ACRBBP_09000 [Bdellovibrionales bacterium]